MRAPINATKDYDVPVAFNTQAMETPFFWRVRISNLFVPESCVKFHSTKKAHSDPPGVPTYLRTALTPSTLCMDESKEVRDRMYENDQAYLGTNLTRVDINFFSHLRQPAQASFYP